MTAFQLEARAIAFRRSLMSCVGGVAWLLHVERLFGFRGLGPGDYGMPDELRIQMHRRGW